ncbi:MAG: NAD(P)-binding domain-containing protein [Bacteroidales bacterium]|nr:NAD(P)-binding domain-containing protein [Bacteroidales bacterium]
MKIVSVEPIGISENRAQEIAAELAKDNHEFICYRDRKEDAATLIERMKDAEVVIVSNIKIGADILSQCPKLKMLDVAFTGLDHIDLDYCQAHNIEVKNASGYATEGVAELAIGLMLDVYRHITALDADIRQGGTRNNFLGKELRGKRVGIVGTGAIGIRTALLLQCFGCEVVAWSRSQKADILAHNIPYVTLEELMSTCDIISLHVPLTKETHHLISRELLEKCKPTAVIINTARGNVVDIDALADLLKAGKLGGAGIDVYEKEPPLAENHPLFSAPNCVLVPHVGYATREAFDDRIDIVLGNLN